MTSIPITISAIVYDDDEDGGGEGSKSDIVDEAISVTLTKWNKLWGDWADKS